MSEPIPESIPTSSDKRSHRPTKKARAYTPTSQQSAQVEALFAHPDREIKISTGPKPKTAAAPPEIVANVQGSSAGAGSGEFHVYKASRRREYERLRLMDEEVDREEKEKEWNEKQEERQQVDEKKLSKNQAKRAKMKARMEKVKKGGAEGIDVDTKASETKSGGNNVEKKKLAPAKVALQGSTNGQPDDDGVEETNGNQNGHSVEEEGGLTFHDDD